MAEKAQNEADTSDLDVFSRPSSSTPQHRPNDTGVHHRGTSHPHGESRPLGEVQDFPDNAFSLHSHYSLDSSHHHHAPHHDGAHQSTPLVLVPSHGTALSHHSSDEESFDDDHHQSSRGYHGGPHHLSESYHHGESQYSKHSVLHPQGKPSYHKESYHDNEAYRHDGSHHRDAYDYSRRHHQQAYQHRRSLHRGETDSHHSNEGSYYRGTPRHHHDHLSEHHQGHQSKHDHGHHDEYHQGENNHSACRPNYLHNDHRYNEYHHGGSQVRGAHKSHSTVRLSPAYSRSTAPQPSVTFNLTHSHNAVHSHASQTSNKVHPQDFSSKTLESWAEDDEQLQKHKSIRAQRAHRKSHSANLFGWLWETLSHLLQGLRKMLRKLTESLVFEVFIFLVVCLNTIMLVAQTFAEVEVRGEWYFIALDSIFLCIYVVEAMLKIIAMGFMYFSDAWNNLDFFIMVMAVLDFLLMQINSSLFKLTVYNQSVVRIFKVFKSLRALRAIRVLRGLRSAGPQLPTLVTGDSEGRGDAGPDSQGVCCGPAQGWKQRGCRLQPVPDKLPDGHCLHFPERGWDSSKPLANQGPPAFSVRSGSWAQIPTLADSASLSTSTHSFLTSLQEVTGTLVRSLPSITAILILMFSCLFLFSVVLRALFRHSDPKRFQNMFTTIFTLFTMLTLDDWSDIYLESRAQGAWYIIPILMVYIIIQYFIFLNLVIAVLVDNFQMALLQGLERLKQEKAAQIHEKLLDDSVTQLSKTELKEVMSEHTKYKYLIEKKFGTMTEKQQELLFHFLQLMAAVERHQQKFRSQASVIDEIVDTTFEAGEEDFRR